MSASVREREKEGQEDHILRSSPRQEGAKDKEGQGRIVRSTPRREGCDPKVPSQQSQLAPAAQHANCAPQSGAPE
eukprot:10677871-Alexandrium_andersonii.AAC.1